MNRHVDIHHFAPIYSIIYMEPVFGNVIYNCRSIRHLTEAAQADGKAAISLNKLKLFRQFYIMVRWKFLEFL